MTQERAVYRVVSDRPPLAGTFEYVLQRVASAPTAEVGRVLALFASSLVNGDDFNLAEIEQLPEQDDRLLCVSLFDYCMNEGLTEDERQAIATAFAPYTEVHAPGTRH